MKKPRRSILPLGLVVLLVGLGVRGWAADLAIDLFYNPLPGGNYEYSLTIHNNGPDDVSVVSITDAPADDPLIGSTLTTPAGILGTYEPLGLIDFLEDTELFSAGTSRSGFGFQSASSPAANFLTFEALTSEGGALAGTVTVVPEPGTAALLMVGLGGLALMLRGRGARLDTL